MTQRKPKPFFKMTAAEKDAFISKLEQGIPRRQLQALSSQEEALWQEAKKQSRRRRRSR